MRLKAIAHSLDPDQLYNVVCRPNSGGVEPLLLISAQLRTSHQQVHLVSANAPRIAIGAGTFIERYYELGPIETTDKV